MFYHSKRLKWCNSHGFPSQTLQEKFKLTIRYTQNQACICSDERAYAWCVSNCAHASCTSTCMRNTSSCLPICIMPGRMFVCLPVCFSVFLCVFWSVGRSVCCRSLFERNTLKKLVQLQALIANLSAAAKGFTASYKVRIWFTYPMMQLLYPYKTGTLRLNALTTTEFYPRTNSMRSVQR